MISVATPPPQSDRLRQRPPEICVAHTPGNLPSASEVASRNSLRLSRWGIGLLLGWLILQVPLFLARPLGPDPELYDLQARTALEGGVLYRDILEPNLPGVVVVHLLIRAVAGSSAAALRGFDLLIVAGLVWLLCRWSQNGDRSDHHRINPWLALALSGFYLAQGECDQCQRDLWALLPALGALTLQHRRLFPGAHVHRPVRNGRWSALLEGGLWATACWIKPHVVVPGALVLALSGWMRGLRRPAIADAALVLGGGVMVSSGVIAWLVTTGAWPHLVETLTVWNPEYLRHGRENWSAVRVGSIYKTLLPWSAVVPLALVLVPRAVRRGLLHGPAAHESELQESSRTASCLLAAFFAGWAAQALLLQNAFAYVQVPLVMLGMGVCWRQLSGRLVVTRVPQALWVAAATLAIVLHPQLVRVTANDWWQAATQETTPELQARLQVDPLPVRTELEDVARYLSLQQLQDGELTVYSASAVSLFRRLGCQPATRFVFTDIHARIFAERRDEIAAALAGSGQKYAVACLLEAGVRRQDLAIVAADDLKRLDGWLSDEMRLAFPFNQTPVYRSGSMVVYQVDRPVQSLFVPRRPGRAADRDVELQVVSGNR